MVTCGHSYCEPCIERHTRNTRNCVICKHDVGPLEAMIPSITLDNMVRKLKNQEQIETSYDDLFICEEKTKDEPKVCRTLSQRAKPRLFFSIAGPTICSSPITPHRRRPLSPSARPTKSSLKIPPESLNFSIDAATSPNRFDTSLDEKKLSLKEDEIMVAGNLFRRNGFGRRSERFTSATQAKSNTFDEEMNVTGERSKMGDESTDGKIKRNSFLRRSLNAIRSKTSRRSFIGTTSFISTQIPEEDGDDDGEVLIHEEQVEGEKNSGGE
uniref:Zinc finger C3HC4 RING-type domain-containing protein n=1 Tax=Caenorhabditis japonica TaxID=281687 RepID=A0A8R1ET85_CAEJA